MGSITSKTPCSTIHLKKRPIGSQALAIPLMVTRFLVPQGTLAFANARLVSSQRLKSGITLATVAKKDRLRMQQDAKDGRRWPRGINDS